MRAKNNKTGEIVTNFNWSKEYGTASYVDGDGLLRAKGFNDGEWTIIDEDNDFDKESLRMETAKDIMVAIVQNNSYLSNTLTLEQIAKKSIMFADELIKQLNKCRVE